MSVKLIKKITPEGGIAKTPLEILERSRKILEDDAKWVQGDLICIRGKHSTADERLEAEAKVVEDIMRNGLCGGGWGVCAMGAASLTAGLNAIVEVDAEHFNWKSRKYERDIRKQLASLVTEAGSWYFETIEPPAVRVKRYRKVALALDQATTEVTNGDYDSIVGVNDGEDGEDDPKRSHKRVLEIFDQAITNLKNA